MPQNVKELRISADKKTLHLVWANGTQQSLSAEFLRVESPSAEVKGHGPNDRRLVSGKRDVTLTGAEPVGNYAVKLLFSDGHRTGLYSWGYLADLCATQSERWSAYERDLAAAGARR